MTSQCTRFLTVFGSGTGTKSIERIGMSGMPSSENQPLFIAAASTP